jgi:hypothetical protein
MLRRYRPYDARDTRAVEEEECSVPAFSWELACSGGPVPSGAEEFSGGPAVGGGPDPWDWFAADFGSFPDAAGPGDATTFGGAAVGG